MYGYFWKITYCYFFQKYYYRNKQKHTKQNRNQMLNQLIDQLDLYATFVDSDEWRNCLKAIKQISLDAAEAVEKYGIGTKVSDDGQYNFQSGQLLADMPKNVRDSEAIHEP